MMKDLSNAEKQFITEVERRGGGLYHDYSNPLHYEYILSRLGSKAYLQQNHPVMFKLFEKTRANHITAKKSNAPPENTDEDGHADSMKVRAISFDKDFVVSDISSNHKKTRPSMAIAAKIVDTTNEQIVATVQTYGDEIDSLLAEMKKKTSELVYSDDRKFKTIADFWWLDDNNDVAANGYTQVYNDFKVVGRNSIVADFTVNAPVVIKTPGRENVVVVYNRTAQVKEDYDYYYNNDYYDTPHGKQVDIYMPASATVTLEKEWTVLGLNRDMGFKLEIEDLKKGVVKYYGQGGFDSIRTEINANVIKFTFQDTHYPGDPKYKDFWANALKISDFGAATTVNIYCQIELDIKNKAGLQIHIPVVFQSKYQPSGDKSIVKSKPIYIQWGCVGKDTLILMHDKTQKVISDVKIWDIVLDENGEAISVTNIFTGQEKTVILLQTAKEKKVLMSSGHPVATRRGIIPAQSLNADDMIKTADGFEAIKELRVVDYNDKVYSLRFSDPHMIACNGIILGDFDTQNSIQMPLAENKAPVRSKECRMAKAEFRKLFEQLSSKS